MGNSLFPRVHWSEIQKYPLWVPFPFIRYSCVHSPPGHKGSAVASRALVRSSCPCKGWLELLIHYCWVTQHPDCNQLPRMLERSSLSGSVISYLCRACFYPGYSAENEHRGTPTDKQLFFHKLAVIVTWCEAFKLPVTVS